MSGAVRNYFLTPKVRFLSLIWLPWHFLHLAEEMGFFTPHLKQTLKKSLRCWAICFLVASVIGNIFLVYPWTKAWFVPFYLCDKTKRGWMSSNIQGSGFVQVMSSRYKNSASAVGSGSCAPKHNNILLHHGVSVFFRSQFIQKLEYWGDAKRLLSHLHNSIEVSSYDMHCVNITVIHNTTFDILMQPSIHFKIPAPVLDLKTRNSFKL